MERERDPIPLLPFPPRPKMRSKPTEEEKTEWSFSMRVWRRLGELLIALKLMFLGALSEEKIDDVEGEYHRAGPSSKLFPLTWGQAGASLREIVEELKAAVTRAELTGLPMQGQAALRRLVRTPLGGYGTELSSRLPPLPSRGEVIPMSVASLSLPKSRLGGVLASTLSPRVAKIFLDPQRRMLRSEEERKAAVGRLQVYEDPVLKDRKTKLALCVRLARAGMLAATSSIKSAVSFFSVVKKVIGSDGATLDTSTGISSAPCSSQAASSGASKAGAVAGSDLEVVQRLIMDEREGNLLWHTPPKAELASAEVISDLDFSRDSLRGHSVHMVKGDCPDHYYRLLVEKWMLPFFIISGILISELNAELSRLGEATIPHGPEEIYVALQVLLMGWAWSVWTAETVMEDLLERSGSLFLRSARLKHGSPAPRISVDQPLLWLTHIDDIICWVLGKSPEEAKEFALYVLKQLQEIIRGAGLGIHKEETGVQLEVIGLQTGEGEDGRMRTMAKPEGLAIVTAGTMELLRIGRSDPVPPNAVEKITGHWSFRCLANRAGFAAFATIYTWIEKTRASRSAPLWQAVRDELRTMVALGPVLYAENDLPLHPEAFSVDASIPGFATCVRRPPAEELAEAYRLGEQKGWFAPLENEKDAMLLAESRGAILARRTTRTRTRRQGSPTGIPRTR